jgi:hypothetical protein
MRRTAKSSGRGESGRSRLEFVRCKDPVMAQQEIEQGTAKNCDSVGGQQREVYLRNQQAHQNEVSDERDQAVGEMKAEELVEC